MQIDIVRLKEYTIIDMGRNVQFFCIKENYFLLFSISGAFFSFMGEKMIKGYMSIKEAAEKWSISPRRIQVLCASERIDGASKLGREWAIPCDAKKPTDKRVHSGQYKNWRKKDVTTSKCEEE